jgi:hypothetical protein
MSNPNSSFSSLTRTGVILLTIKNKQYEAVKANVETQIKAIN